MRDGMEKAADFEDFYRREYQRVYKAIRLSGGDGDGTHDITQEAFKRAYARWGRLARHEWAGGWVMTTALNLMRRARKAPRDEPLDTSHDLVAPMTDRDADLYDALRKLPNRQKAAILLYYLGDLPIRGVAETMNVADGTVKALLSQGRQSLSAVLGDEDE